MKQFLSGSGIFARICVLFGVIMTGFLLMSIISGLLILFSGFPQITILKILQFIQTILIFIIPALLVAFWITPSPFTYLGIRKSRPMYLLITLAILICMIPAMNWIIQWNESITFPAGMQGLEQWFKSQEKSMSETINRILIAKSAGGWLVSIFLAGVCAAVGEELFFRGLIQNILSKGWGNRHAAVIFTAFIFSAIHLQFYGLIPRFILGAIFGYLFIWSNSIWVPVFAHFINNSMALLGLYLENSPNGSSILSGLEDISSDFVIPSFIATSVLIYLIYWYSNKRRKDNQAMI